MQRLNPAQYKVLERHIDRAVEALEEGDRLLRGAVGSIFAPIIEELRGISKSIGHEEVETIEFDIEEIPEVLISYVENPFAQSLAFNLYCIREGLSHTRARTEWGGGAQASAARNLVFLPGEFYSLWEDGLVDRTKLIHIADRALTNEGYSHVGDLLKSRRRDEVEDFLNRTPVHYLRVGRRGPEQALEACETHGWMELLQRVQIPKNLVDEAEAELSDNRTPEQSNDEPYMQAVRQLRSGLNGAKVHDDVINGLRLSPDPQALVQKFLTAHRKSNDVDPLDVGKTLFFAHAGPITKMVADDKMLLRQFQPVKTQKRGQLFYRLLEVIEGIMLEKLHLADLDSRGITEAEAIEAVRLEVSKLNQDPNRYLEVPEQWLGEVTRRHLYFGSRTRKDGSAYKWYRKIDTKYFLGGHKTTEDLAEKEARKNAKLGLDS